MVLTQVILKNFRNFTQAKFAFDPKLTIVIGDNAHGKTNLLEAIYLIMHISGFREAKEEELMTFGKDLTQVQGIFKDKESEVSYYIVLRKNRNLVEKSLFINKTKRRYIDYQKEVTKAVLFSPEQIGIITSSPDRRRKYFDSVLRGFDLEYKKKLSSYEIALRKRNKILEHHTNELNLKNELVFWNKLLEELAGYITLKREEYLWFLNQNQKIDNREFAIKYIKNEFTKARWEEKFDLERRVRKTMIGPQKDDFQIYEIDGEVQKNIQHYGSRSEQRLGVFWLKLNEMLYLEKNFNTRPILLLDDIFSELDTKNKKLVVELIKKYQTVVTTTDSELVDPANMEKIIIKL